MPNYTDLSRDAIEVILRNNKRFDSKAKFDGISWQVIYNNGFGISIVKFFASYGGTDDLWELAVIEDDDKGGYNLTENTPITDEVIGYLTEQEVIDYSEKVRLLEGRSKVIRFSSNSKG